VLCFLSLNIIYALVKKGMFGKTEAGKLAPIGAHAL